MLLPLKDWLLVQLPPKKTQTTSGLYLPEKAQGPSNYAKVLDKGPDVKHAQVGDHVLFFPHSGTPVTINGQELLFVREEDLLAREPA